MATRALGVIETIGFVPAVEAADAAVKSADVTIQGFQYTGQGLVSVIIRGDISSVKAAIEVAATAAELLGIVRSSTVIGRVSDGLTIVIDEAQSDQAQLNIEKQSQRAAYQESLLLIPDRSALEAMRVIELRQLVRQLDGFPMDKKIIKYARKVELLEQIAKYKNSREI